MKRTGRHPHRALSAIQVRSLTKPGRYADGNGLYLVVDSSGAQRWLLRTVVNGRRRDMGLGSVRLVSLADARERAATYRKIARDGGDPLVERNKHRRVAPRFADAARRVYDAHKAAWKNEKHAAQWINTLEHYAFPLIGTLPVDRIESADILRVLSPIWLTKPETAKRVRQRMGTVLDWAKTAGFRDGENPIAGVTKGLPRQPDRANHHRAIAYPDVPLFFEDLESASVAEATKIAFKYLVLTGARTGEVLGARWEEVDFDRRVWTIPAGRMKSGKEHRVPLSQRAVILLHRAKALSGSSGWVFPGRDRSRAMSNMVLLMALRRMSLPFTVHGFRSAFRDWAAERTNIPTEVCEMALAHTIRSKVEAAYRRGDLFDKRRKLMDAWSAFVAPKPTRPR